jgi:hypothetical protein
VKFCKEVDGKCTYHILTVELETIFLQQNTLLKTVFSFHHYKVSDFATSQNKGSFYLEISVFQHECFNNSTPDI